MWRRAQAISSRALFYARCTLLEDLAYGKRSGLRAYTDKSLTALGWLFPDAPRSADDFEGVV